MDYRFNSFYHDEMHPFIEAMGGFLVESGNKSRRTLPAIFYREADRKYQQDIDSMRKTADELLSYRKEHPSDRKDLLNAMLNGVDPRTGQKMTDQSITDNLITMLIAGHETTGGTLSFSFYNLLKHPEVYRKAQQEVDSVVGTGPVTVDHIPKLQYIQAVSRLCPHSFAMQTSVDTVFIDSARDAKAHAYHCQHIREPTQRRDHWGQVPCDSK